MKVLVLGGCGIQGKAALFDLSRNEWASTIVVADAFPDGIEGLAYVDQSKIEAIKTSIERTGSSLVEAALTTIAGITAIYFVNTPALNEFVSVIILMTALSCIAAAFILPVIYNVKYIK